MEGSKTEAVISKAVRHMEDIRTASTRTDKDKTCHQEEAVSMEDISRQDSHLPEGSRKGETRAAR